MGRTALTWPLPLWACGLKPPSIWVRFAVLATGMVGWQHTFGDMTPSSSMAFADGQAFAVEGTPVVRDIAVVEAGLNLFLAPDMTLGGSYGAQFGAGFAEQNVKLDFSVKF